MSQLILDNTVLIEDLAVHVNIGCSAEERAFPQRLLFSLEIKTKNISETLDGDLSKTVCYAKTCELITTLCKSKEWVLLEDLADKILKGIFRAFSSASEIQLKIKKFAVPHTAWTGIRVEQKRP